MIEAQTHKFHPCKITVGHLLKIHKWMDDNKLNENQQSELIDQIKDIIKDNDLLFMEHVRKIEEISKKYMMENDEFSKLYYHIREIAEIYNDTKERKL